MKLIKKDLKPRVIDDQGTKALMVPDEDGFLEPKECRILGFGLSQFQVTLSLTQDVIKTGCPSKPMSHCEEMIEFDAGEIEDLFKESEAFQTACPGCGRPLGLIKSKTFERSFFFGWLP